MRDEAGDSGGGIVGAKVGVAVAEGLGVDVSEDGEESCWSCAGLRMLRGVVFVGPVFMKFVIRSGVLEGVTLSMNWKAGRRRTVVLWSEWSGMGIFEAESMRRWKLEMSLAKLKSKTKLDIASWRRDSDHHTPLLGFTLPLSTASIMLPFSSATSRTQSLFPVATIKWVLHPLICPYNSSVSSISNFLGYLTTQLEQSCSHSSPSIAGSVVGNNASVVDAFANSAGSLAIAGEDARLSAGENL